MSFQGNFLSFMYNCSLDDLQGSSPITGMFFLKFSLPHAYNEVDEYPTNYEVFLGIPFFIRVIKPMYSRTIL